MRGLKYLFFLVFLAAFAVQAESVQIVKVLPYYLDKEGRNALKPSLYERDAYQAYLRKNPDLRKSMRFDVQWKASGHKEITIKLELHGSRNGEPQAVTIEQTVKVTKKLLGNWTSLPLDGEKYTKLGDIASWRATLWDGDKMIAEQKSFLW